MEEESRNNRTPVEVVRLFIETTTKLFEQNKDAIEHSAVEVKDLRDKVTETVNILNQNPTNQEIMVKLDTTTARTNTMITVVKTAFTILTICVALSVIGSQLLYKSSMVKIKNELSYMIKNRVSVEGPDLEYDRIIKKMEEHLEDKNETK